MMISFANVHLLWTLTSDPRQGPSKGSYMSYELTQIFIKGYEEQLFMLMISDWLR